MAPQRRKKKYGKRRREAAQGGGGPKRMRLRVDTFLVASRLINALMPLVLTECEADPLLGDRLFQVRPATPLGSEDGCQAPRGERASGTGVASYNALLVTGLCARHTRLSR